eukprot:GHUV01018032.1.p1 GENE.GHUV01018032.1~~GHUV01018032.1.p1  ORF type:complete len:118 (+),score=31.14 GHUV01018032.1:94-447(+)
MMQGPDPGLSVLPRAVHLQNHSMLWCCICLQVLLDQDIAHRLSTPSAAAGQPRYSLVWKLVMFPKQPGGRCSIAKPEWGRPTYFGSAAHVERAVRDVASTGTAAASRKRPAVDNGGH